MWYKLAKDSDELIHAKTDPMRKFRSICFVFLLVYAFAGIRASAQRQVTFGNATVELTGLWKFHTGDNMVWAQPGFDDSTWGTINLTPLPGTYDPFTNTSGFVPGWTAQGYRGYSGFAWYRLRVNIQNGQSALALKMPNNFDDAYQVYVNGQFIGEFGRFTESGITVYDALPKAFPLPANVRSGPVTLAIRMWMASFTPLVDPDAGGLHAPPVMGHAGAIGELLQLDWDARNRASYGYFLEIFIVLLALLVAFGLFLLDRREPAYMWLGLTCAAILGYALSVVIARYSTWIGTSLFLINDALLTPLYIGLWVLFWAYWFRLGNMARMHRMVWSIVLMLGFTTAMLRAPLYGSVIPIHAAVWIAPLTVVLRLVLGVLLIWVTVRGTLKNQTEGWLATPAVALVVLSLYREELLRLHLPMQIFPFGIGIPIDTAATILSLTIITVLLLRRFVRGQREQEKLRLEVEQARQVQQVLIPEALPVIPGFTLESEYRPAQQVGGDFFQILEGADNSVLIVVGDVSGKGLKAAMLVSLIVGTIRTLAKFTRDPMEVLRGLNERLCGRMQGHFATCVVAHIAANGETTIANAGHLAPYLNGAEIAVAGSLPLGIVQAAEFSGLDFQLRENDRLTFMTDGIVEAQDQKKELFGFARTTELMQQKRTAVEIAGVAQVFGQEDDITVVQVVRASA